MSRCIDLFIDAPVELGELAAELGKLTGLVFALDPDGTGYVTRQGEVVLTMGEHDFVDDARLPLSSYRYDLYSRVSTSHVLDSPEAHLLRHVLSLVKANGQYPALLVFDLQHIIGRADGSESTPIRA